MYSFPAYYLRNGQDAMKLTIRKKLILLGLLSVGALVASSYLSYSGGEIVRVLNDQSRYIQSNRDMSIRMVKQYNTFATHYYQALADRAGGALAQEDSDAIAENMSGMRDMIERFIDRKTKYPDDKLKEGMAIIDELTPLMQKEFPQLMAAHASEQDFEALNKKIEAKLPTLGEMANDADAAVREQLLDIAAEVNDDLLDSNKKVLVVLGVALAAMIPILVLIIFSITRPLKVVISDINRLASGDFSQELGGKNRKDEIGDVVKALNALQEYTANKAKEEAEAEMRKKALVDEEKKQALQQLANDFEQSVGSIVNMVSSAATELSQTAECMVGTAKDSAQKASNASGMASSTTANVQSVAAASEELSATVKEISAQIQKTTTLVHESQDKARNADTVANTLNEATTKVAAAMEMITNIAGQINLLALNATIESARAGEAGKGFAVVASEVKNLATQTNKTTEDIQHVVQEMQQAAQSIIAALKEISGSVSSISEATSSVASAVEEQSATTGEISRNMQTAASSTQSISNSLQDVQASSSTAGSASEQMLMASKELSKQAEELNKQVNNFLRRVRAG